MNSIVIGALVCVIACVINSANAGITTAQMEKAFVVVRNVCQPKTKATDDQIAGIRTGKWTNEKPQKCYTHCVMELMGAMKRSKIVVEGATKQFDVLLPDSMKESYKKALNTCKDEAKGIKDTCEAGFLFTKCFQLNIDEFFFP